MSQEIQIIVKCENGEFYSKVYLLIWDTSGTQNAVVPKLIA